MTIAVSSAWRIIPRPQRDILGEGLLWSARENAVFWTDIIGRKVWRLSLADDSICDWAMPEPIGWIIERAAGGFIAGLQTGIHHLSFSPLALVRLVDPEPHLPLNRLNDAKADAQGRIWAGTMPANCTGPSGALYRFDPDGTLTRHDSALTIANGPAISPDGTIFYHTDSALGTVYRFDLRRDGSLGPRTEHLVFTAGDGAPDGMTCDAQGGLWIAFYGGSRIARFHPDGTHDRSIALPTPQITNIVFAGENLDCMFVTSAGDGRRDDAFAGALFEVGSAATGLLPHLFGG